MKYVLAIVLSLCFLLCLAACKPQQKPDKTTNDSATAVTDTSTTQTETTTVLSAEEIRKNIRGKCDGTFQDAKRIFAEEYAGKEFLLEYFFTDKEWQTIQLVENNGENQVFYETYRQGWVEVKSLVGEVGDEEVYIGEQDPFVENFIWE